MKSKEELEFESEMADPKEVIEQLIHQNNDKAIQPTLTEEITKKGLNWMFEDSKLLYTSSLSREYSYYITKMLIIDAFYLKYWNNVSVKHELKSLDYPPFYQITHTIKNKNSDSDCKVYRNFIDDLLKITISIQGMGRQQLADILKAKMIEAKELELLQAKAKINAGQDLRGNLNG